MNIFNENTLTYFWVPFFIILFVLFLFFGIKAINIALNDALKASKEKEDEEKILKDAISDVRSFLVNKNSAGCSEMIKKIDEIILKNKK